MRTIMLAFAVWFYVANYTYEYLWASKTETYSGTYETKTTKFTEVKNEIESFLWRNSVTHPHIVITDLRRVE